MKKSITYLLIIWGFCLSTAQNTVENDTIYLSEVIVSPKKKDNLKKISSKGKLNFSIRSDFDTFFAKEIKTDECIIPKKITFFVEKIDKNDDTKATFELAFLSVDENGYPNERLHNETFLFESIGKNKLEINIEELSQKFCGNFFVALKKVEDTNRKSSNYKILGQTKKRKKIFVNAKNKGWYKIQENELAIEIYYTEEK